MWSDRRCDDANLVPRKFVQIKGPVVGVARPLGLLAKCSNNDSCGLNSRAANVTLRQKRATRHSQWLNRLDKGLRRSILGEYDQRLEFVAACFAFPEMPYAMSVQILGPFREEDRLPALGTMVFLRSAVVVVSGLVELHDATSVMLPRHEAHGSAVA